MKLNSVICGLDSPGTGIENQKIRIVYVNSMNVEQRELFKGTVKEMVNKYKANEPFGAGVAEEWYVVGYNYVACTIADEVMPVFTRPIEIRVI